MSHSCADPAPRKAPRHRRLAPGWVLGLLALGAQACSGPPAALDRRPLFGPGSHPEILQESSRLEPPPATTPNRFLAGWWPWDADGCLALGGAPEGARLQIVQLAARPRELVLDLVDRPAGETHSDETVRVLAAGEEIAQVPLADPLRVPLPPSLPLGKVTLELRPSGGGPLDVLDAAVRPSLPPAEVRLEGGDLLQQGDSWVELVEEIGPGAELVGNLVPPDSPVDGQGLSLTVERLGGSGPPETSRFDWSADDGWGGLKRRRSIRLPAGDDGGLVRVRFRATGRGSAGRWSDLHWERAALSPAAAASSTETASAGAPPTADTLALPRLVVLYVMDALRADTVGHLGGPEGVSPTVDRLAEEGLTFLHHRSVAPNTLPSSKALFTGEIFADRGGWKLPPDGRPTLAEEFRRAGFHTGLFSGNGYVSPAYGMDRGFDFVSEATYFEEGAEGSEAPFNDNAARVHREALRWIESLPAGEPAFLYLHTIHPHNPYDPPEPFRSRFSAGAVSPVDGSTATLLAIQHRRLEIDEAGERKLRGLYAGALAYNDAELARLLDALGGLYAPEETLLIVTSDHGEELFDHGGVLHGYTLYEEMIHIPLVVWAPGRVRPGATGAATSTVDLHATLIDLLGRRGAVPSDGRSLRRLWASGGAETDRGTAGPGAHFAAAASVDGGIFSLQKSGWKLIWAPRRGRAWGQGEGPGRTRDPEYLFDLEADPEERHNRLGEGDPRETWLRSELQSRVAARLGAEEGGAEPTLDEESRKRLEALGYVD